MKKVKLGIRGGGVKSAVGIGVIRALSENKIPITEVSGASIGSVVAALFAAGRDWKDILTLFKEYVLKYSDATFIKGGNGSGIIEQTVNAECSNKTFYDLDIPLTISANQGGLLRPKNFIFNKESTPLVNLGEACRASASFPFIYERYRLMIDGKQRKFLDGGMTANPPVLEKEKDSIFILATFLRAHKRDFYKSSLQAKLEADIIISPILTLHTLGNSDDIEYAYRVGYQKTLENLEQIYSLIQ